MTVVSDTSIFNYLVTIDEIDILGELFGLVLVPDIVIAELKHPTAPEKVRTWANRLPEWIQVRSPSIYFQAFELDPGEQEAISLGLELHLSMLLIDDREGREAAIACGLVPFGTLGILEYADFKGLIIYEDAVKKLLKTSFRASNTLLERVQARVAARRANSQRA